jgi:peptidyl-prolyl cis-trans isomerase C
VQSDFGWHVIRLDETREEPTPTFEGEQARIREELAREMFAAEVENVRAGATIEIAGEPPAGATPAQ